MTISTPHWWAPIRAKQLSVALSSFVGWLGRQSLVAANRASCPLATVSVLLTWSGGVISSDSICHKSLLLGNVYKFPFAYSWRNYVVHFLTQQTDYYSREKLVRVYPIWLHVFAYIDIYYHPSSCTYVLNMSKTFHIFVDGIITISPMILHLYLFIHLHRRMYV